MLVVLAEPRELVHSANAESRTARAQVGAAAKSDVAYAAGAVGKGRVHEHAAVGQQRVRRPIVAARVHVDAALAQNRILYVRRMASLHAAAVVRAVAAVRGKFGGERLADWRLPVPVAVEGQIEGLATARARRREVHAAEQGTLIAEPIVRNAAGNGGRYVGELRNGEQPRHRVCRDAGRLQADGIGIDERLEIIGATSELVRHVVERLVHHDGTRHGAAERQIAVLLSERTRRAVRPLELGRIDVEAGAAANEVRSRSGLDVELPAAESTTAHIVRRGNERGSDGRIARNVGAAEVLAVERRRVLICGEAEHREAGRIAVGAGHGRDAGE